MTAVATDPRLDPALRGLYPFAGKYVTVTHGARQHYLDEGQGETVLMVHGNPTWSFYYRRLVQGLSADYRCIVPDHVGCGLSDQPADYPYTIRTHIDNLVSLIEQLDLRDITLVVHDWGGPIGFGAALRLPDRFKRFVVFNTAVFQGPMPLSIAMCRVPGLGRAIIQGANGFVRGALLRGVVNRGMFGGDVARGYLAPYDSWGHRAVQHAFVQEIPMKPAHHNWELIAGLDSGTQDFREAPMLVMWGDADFCFTPWYRDEWMKRFPASELHHWADVGHWVADEAADRALPLMRAFLAKHPLA